MVIDGINRDLFRIKYHQHQNYDKHQKYHHYYPSSLTAADLIYQQIIKKRNTNFNNNLSQQYNNYYSLGLLEKNHFFKQKSKKHRNNIDSLYYNYQNVKNSTTLEARSTKTTRNYHNYNHHHYHRNSEQKMPPITEKQRSPSIIKGNVKENYPTSASNGIANNKQPLSDKIENRVPEIIDFRDSWLQEIEMYKDQIKAQQQQHFLLIQQQQQEQHQNSHQVNGHHHHHQHSPQIFTTTQGHLYYDNEVLAAETAVAISEQQKISGKVQKNLDSAKRRIRSRSDSSDPLDIRNGHHRRMSNESDDGLVLKRAREDITISATTATGLTTNITTTNKQSRHDSNSSRHLKIRNRKRKSPSPSTTIISSSISSSLAAAMISSSSNIVMPEQQRQHKVDHEHDSVNKTAKAINTSRKIIANPYHASLLNDSRGEVHKQNITANNDSDSNILPFQSNPNINQTITSTIIVDESKESSLQSKLIKSPQLPLTTTKTITKNLNDNECATTLSTSSSVDVPPSSTDPDILSDNMKIPSQEPENDEDDDDLIGEVDDADIYDSSEDDCDDRYAGYAYYLNSEEEDEAYKTKFSSSDQSTTTTTTTTTVTDQQHYITPESALSPSLFPNVPPYINFSSHVEKGPQIPTEIQKILKWKYTTVMPKIVKRVVTNSGFRQVKKCVNDWVGTWETHMKSPRFKTIRSYQKYNHLPGTFKIGRKDSVWKNLKLLIGKHGKKEFGIMPKTYILPQDSDELKKAWPKYFRRNTKWIVKPPAAARGAGIKVVNRWSQIPKGIPLIVQKYIERPLLIEGNKFDLRLYVLVTSVNPLRIFMHTDGLARFASVQYSDNLESLNDRCMHLTNYSINKLSSNYAKNEDINACQGHKWTLKSLWSYFNKRGIDTKRLWATLRNLVIRTIISGESWLNKMFKQNVSSKYSCFELFGFDVLLDEDLIPWLLEVNISPSLHSDLALDQHIKGPLIQATLNTALYQVPAKLPEQIEKQVLKDHKLGDRLCQDKRLYTPCLSAEEIRKHIQFISRAIDDRSDYIDAILDELTPDDVRCLIIAEDELSRCSPLERIFPGPNSYEYLKFMEVPRYYNRLLDAWETKYSEDRSEGIQLLRKLCESEYHLKVPSFALIKNNSDEKIDKLLSEESEGKDITSNDLTRTNSITSISTDDQINTSTTSSGVINDSNGTVSSSSTGTPVSCSKEATAATSVTTTDSKSQLNGPRPIVVKTQ